MNDNGLKDKRVFVTSSETGIGREIGLEFAREGVFAVFITLIVKKVQPQHKRSLSERW